MDVAAIAVLPLLARRVARPALLMVVEAHTAVAGRAVPLAVAPVALM